MTNNTNDTTWQAVLATLGDDIYPSVEDARNDLDDDEEMTVWVVRTRVVASKIRIGELRRPGAHQSADVASSVDCFLTDDDESVSAAVRFAQAKAMAAGLNTAEATR